MGQSDHARGKSREASAEIADIVMIGLLSITVNFRFSVNAVSAVP
jgi:hypothetical protein